jgi:ATP-dependent Clp protease ATP-binding subunit ClpC
MLQETKRRLHAQNVLLELTPAAVEWIARRGYQLSRRLLDGRINPGQKVTVGVQDGHLTFLPDEQQVPARAG